MASISPYTPESGTFEIPDGKDDFGQPIEYSTPTDYKQGNLIRRKLDDIVGIHLSRTDGGRDVCVTVSMICGPGVHGIVYGELKVKFRKLSEEAEALYESLSNAWDDWLCRAQ